MALPHLRRAAVWRSLRSCPVREGQEGGNDHSSLLAGVVSLEADAITVKSDEPHIIPTRANLPRCHPDQDKFSGKVDDGSTEILDAIAQGHMTYGINTMDVRWEDIHSGSSRSPPLRRGERRDHADGAGCSGGDYAGDFPDRRVERANSV